MDLKGLNVVTEFVMQSIMRDVVYAVFVVVSVCNPGTDVWIYWGNRGRVD